MEIVCITLTLFFVYACPRDRCRNVRNILQKEMYLPSRAYNYELPATCPISPITDQYAIHEDHKKRVRYRQHQCLFCQKTFRSEYWLDLHMERKHSAEVPENATGCLADYCEIFKCDNNEDDDKQKTIGPNLCEANIMKTKRLSCLALINKCFPVEQSKIAHRLHDQFVHKYCDVLECQTNDNRNLSKDNLSTLETLRFIGSIFLCLIMVGYFLAIAIFRWEGPSRRRVLYKINRGVLNRCRFCKRKSQAKVY